MTTVTDSVISDDGNHIAFIAMDTAESSNSSLPYQPEVFEENQTQRRSYITNVAREGYTPHRIQVEGSVYMIEWRPDASQRKYFIPFWIH